jgi:hypothetical protein
MSAWVYSGPAQFAVLEPRAASGGALLAAIMVAQRTRCAVTGMIIGTILVSLLSWIY